MRHRRRLPLILCGFLFANPVHSQSPLSAIDWLEKPLRVPVVVAKPMALPNKHTIEPAVTHTADVPLVTVTELGQPNIGAVGLLPSNITGLPRTLWENTDSDRLAALIGALNVDDYPAMQSLLYTLLLAEVDPPKDNAKSQDSAISDKILLTRIDKLMDLGAVEPAEAMLLRAGTTTSTSTPQLFQRWFDLTLLNGSEDKACDALKARPHLSPGYSAEIFCTARKGDWMTAALTLDTARALGFVTKYEADILSRFLDPETVEGKEALPVPTVMTPLVFRLFEANGTPLPTRSLPRRYAMADLRNTSGWKSELEAAERLARTSALSENRLLGIYSKGKPAASGGIWDRVKAIQHLDKALKSGKSDVIEAALEPAWEAVKSARLEIPFARLFGDALLDTALSSNARSLAFHIALLAANYEEAAKGYAPQSKKDRFLAGIAKGTPSTADSPDVIGRAIADGFATITLPDRFAARIENGELGMAILRAMDLFSRSSGGNPKGISDAIITLRAVGLEDVARRASLQLMLLERGG